MRATAYVPKGGVSKTTTTAHMAVAAAQDHGLDVLLIDLAGNQNDLATQFGLADDVADPDAPISAVFGEDWSFIRDNIPDVVDRMVYPTGEGPDLIPADAGLSGADNNLANVAREKRYTKLEAFVSDDLASRYDLVLLDLPGKEDNITLNGLFAAEDVITPLKPGEFEKQQLENLFVELDELRRDFDGQGDTPDVNPRIRMILPTTVDRRENYNVAFVTGLEADYPDLTYADIPKSANVGSLQTEGKTLFAAADDELYDTGRRARDAYRAATDELLSRLEAH